MTFNAFTPDPNRKYPDNPGADKWRATPIRITKSKTDYSSMEKDHPDDPLNNEYIRAGAALDCIRPLCFAVHDGVICKRPVTWREGSKYCNKGRGDG